MFSSSSLAFSPPPPQWYSLLKTIALAKDVEDFLREQVQSGVAANQRASE
jgi:hypothetical protein